MNRIFSVAMVTLAAGCYAGNVVIAIGQGIFMIGLGLCLLDRGAIRLSSSSDFPFPKSAFFLLGFLLVNAISILVHLESYDYPLRELKKLRHFALPLVLLAIPKVRKILYLESRRSIMVAAYVFVGVAVVVTLADMINLAAGFHPLVPGDGIERGDRLGGIFGMVMTYSYGMQFAFLVMVGASIVKYPQFFGKKRWEFLFFAISSLICGAGLFLSGSRGSWLGALIGAVILVILIRSPRLYILLAAVVILSIVVLLASGSRFLQVKPNEGTRFVQWKVAAMTGWENPLTGIGYKQFQRQSVELKKGFGFPPETTLMEGRKPVYDGDNPVRYYKKAHAHNIYLEAFATTGFPGLLFLLLFFGFWCREMLAHSELSLLFLPGLVGFCVAGFFENSFFDGEVTTLVMGFYLVSQFMRYSLENGEPIPGIVR